MIHRRKLEYRLYPTKHQDELLHETRRLHQRLYNAALHHRRLNYEILGKPIGYVEQAKLLTELRTVRPDYADLNAQSSQVTLKRVDLAFQHFFRRLRAKTRPAGFPRFKSLDRYTGWGYTTHGSGWRLLTNDTMTNGRLRLSGIGVIKLRGSARTPGIPKTCEIVYKAGRWYASITVLCEPRRTCGTKAAGLDWGTGTFLTIAESNGTVHTIENPRVLRKRLPALKRAQQNLSRKKRGSKNRRKAIRAIATIHRQIGHQRRNFLHQTSHRLVQAYGLLATEDLKVKNLTAAGGRRKRGLNREILSTSPSRFLQILACKAEEAGSWYIAFSPRTIKPSQTCHHCGRQEPKALSDRQHVCPCGMVCGRDENAAKVLLHWALTGNAPGSGRARCGDSSAGCPRTRATQLRSRKQESPSRAAKRLVGEVQLIRQILPMVSIEKAWNPQEWESYQDQQLSCLERAVHQIEELAARQTVVIPAPVASPKAEGVESVAAGEPPAVADEAGSAAGLLVVCQESRAYQAYSEQVLVQTIYRAVTHLQRKRGSLCSADRELLSQAVGSLQQILAGPIPEQSSSSSMEHAA